MKKFFTLVCTVLVAFILAIIGFAHPGGTDENGGHYDRSTGEYHYHHGYSAHQHEDGVCPYELEEEELTIKWSCDVDGCTVEEEHYHFIESDTTTEATTTETTEPPTTYNEQKREKKYDLEDVLLCLCIGVLGLITLCDFASRKLKK